MSNGFDNGLTTSSIQANNKVEDYYWIANA